MTTPLLPLGDARPFAIALVASLVVIAGVTATFLASFQATGGAFLYVLDDPYIHLQLARTLALHGVYGLHADEVSAPSSSILWPLFLAPAARAAWFEYLGPIHKQVSQ